MERSITAGLMSAVAGLLLTLGACGDAPDPGEEASSSNPVIYTTFYPTTYFAEQIGGDAVEVRCPVPDDADPIFWKPQPEAIVEYQRASLIIVNGAEFEKWVATAALPRSRVVETAEGVEGGFIQMEGITHSHGPAGEHAHEGVDGHTWLDPVNAEAQARVILEALVERFPEHEKQMRANATALNNELRTLHEALQELTPMLADVQLVASHPAYNYLARRYGWEITNLDLDPEADLSESEIAAILAELAVPPAERKTVLLWESSPTPATTDALSAVGIRSVLFSPAEMIGAEERAAGVDYGDIMRDNVARLRMAAEGP